LHVRNLGLLSLVSVSCCIATLYAQTPAPAAPVAQGSVPLLKENVRAVVVDVVVTKGEQPIAGLHQQDFQVIEDGKPQAIDFFEEHTAKSLPPGALPPMPKMPPDVYTNVPPVPENDSVNVLLLDSLNTEKADQAYVHQQILNFLKTMPPGVRCAIFMLGSKLRFVQGFTTDTSVLTAALNDKKNGVSPEKDSSSRSRSDAQADKDRIDTMVMMSNGHMTAGIGAIEEAQTEIGDFQYARRTAMTLEALQYLARYLGGVPGRKNLIWFASAFPVNVFPSAAQKDAMNNARVYVGEVKKTADLLTVSKVAVYPIGAEGMMNDHWMEAGGAGGLIVQMAKRLGARVFGTVSTEAKAEVARRHGADEAILYTRDDFDAEVKRSTSGRGVYDGFKKSCIRKYLELTTGTSRPPMSSSTNRNPFSPTLRTPKTTVSDSRMGCRESRALP